MEVYRFSFQPIDSSMYVVLDGDVAVIVDPCVSEEALQMVREAGVRWAYLLLTHEHYDHISGVNWWRENVECRVVCTFPCGENIRSTSRNASKHYEVLFLFASREVQEQARAQNIRPFTCSADIMFEGRLTILTRSHRWELTATPGHSAGSCCIMLDEGHCFTGDSLLRDYATITRLPSGNREQYKETVKNYFMGMGDDMRIYPGHGVPFLYNDVKKRFL